MSVCMLPCDPSATGTPISNTVCTPRSPDAPAAELSEAQAALEGDALQEAIDAAFFQVCFVPAQLLLLLLQLLPSLMLLHACRACCAQVRTRSSKRPCAHAPR